ncbi:tRNA (guanine-N(1)-)-methyltransferase [Terrihabitans soli]|uniref:tRNA (guanine-N(1)-)-methyltransferase n=1 Tax=Terrihabitans soli TaxID=708113 RepID=A0A6S6QJQ8_9HYPH|nr:tRNA (guanosine(37)-N1)-methyltransferase TrmD [Terrihabitans soli]BCJ89466.1 tRNA (guanine-N(1)-)-methyltransferase [Terrihabitans soli]
MSWRATVLTLFPEMFPGPLGVSLAGRAKEAGAFTLEAVDPRGFAKDKHRSVDDTPFGGGPGMVLRPDILSLAIASVDDGRPKLLMTPRGAPISQDRVRALAAGPGAILVCGRFEGVDERVIASAGLEEVSVGDVVLSGGEPAALLILDACIRLLPGTMGHEASGSDESFEQNLLEYPQFTKPQDWQGEAVPEVLLSGDHKAIAAWRRLKALQATRARRPDLFAKYVASLTAGVDKPPKTE